MVLIGLLTSNLLSQTALESFYLFQAVAWSCMIIVLPYEERMIPFMGINFKQIIIR